MYWSTEDGWTFVVPKETPIETMEPIKFVAKKDNTHDQYALEDKAHLYYKIPHVEGDDKNCGRCKPFYKS